MQQMKSQLGNGKGWSQGQDQGPGASQGRSDAEVCTDGAQRLFCPPVCHQARLNGMVVLQEGGTVGSGLYNPWDHHKKDKSPLSQLDQAPTPGSCKGLPTAGGLCLYKAID